MYMYMYGLYYRNVTHNHNNADSANVNVHVHVLYVNKLILNVKVGYLIIRHEESRMRYKRGVPRAEAIPVNFCEIRRSTKKLGTL